MQRAWNEVAKYVANNALNPRKGYRLKEISDAVLLEKAMDELEELIAEPNHLDELADLFNCLFHYAQRQGWTLEMLENEMIRKLALRFPETAAQLSKEHRTNREEGHTLLGDSEIIRRSEEEFPFVKGQWNDPDVAPADRSGS